MTQPPDAADLWTLVREQQERIVALETQLAAQPSPEAAPGQPTKIGRRAAFGLAGAGLATAAVAVTPNAAAAGSGDPMFVGVANSETTTTTITNSATSSSTGLHVANTDAANAFPAIFALATGGSGVQGSSATGLGVEGVGDTGVRGDGTTFGVVGVGNTNIGVYGTGDLYGVEGLGGTGVVALGDDFGVDAVANGDGGVGLRAEGPTGIVAGVNGIFNGHGGVFSGEGIGQIRLVPSSILSGPSSVPNLAGSILVDVNGDIYFCTEDGNPGTWTQLNDQTSGLKTGPTFLPTSQRAFDSRAGRAGDGGTKGTFAGGENRVIDLTVDTDLPTGATAAIVNVTAVLAGTASGFLSIYSGGVADLQPPKFSSVNWSTLGAVIANTTSTAVSSSGNVKVYASSATDVIVDVIGYYA